MTTAIDPNFETSQDRAVHDQIDVPEAPSRFDSILRPIRSFRLRYVPVVMVYFAYGALGLIDVTRDLWIKQFHAESLAAFKQFDGIVLNDLEARLLTNKINLVSAIRDLQALVKPTGPRIVLLKKVRAPERTIATAKEIPAALKGRPS